MSIPQHRRASCFFCKQELDIDAFGIHQYTKGWVKSRSQGGGNAVALPDREAKWAHGYCVDQKSRGTLGQGGLFETPVPPAPPAPPAGPTNAHLDDQGRLIHVNCAECGARGAPFGVGVSLRNNQLGLWYCLTCRPVTVVQSFP